MRTKTGFMWVGAGLALALLGACGSKPTHPAPVEDRGAGTQPAPQTDNRTVPVKQPPGFENAGKPGYYTIKPGDTLIRIGLETGQSHKDIARWNNIENPNRIEIGQVVRVVPPVETTPVVSKPAPATAVVAAPLPAAGAKPANGGAKPAANGAEVASSGASGAGKPTTAGAATSGVAASGTPVAGAATPAATGATASGATPTAPAANPQAANADDDVPWQWPAPGAVLAGFDESRNKGLDIGGNAGDPVLASADGKVVYAGSSLRGYGNLVILKHNNSFLTAYAHNRALLVKEDQTVKRGQKIAEMGNTDADRVKLHFELRKQGKPVDPAKYLPAR